MKETKFKQTEIGEIPEDWEVQPLSVICEKIGDGIHATPNYSNGTCYFINGNNIKNGSIVLTSETQTVSQEEAKKYRVPLNNNTVLLSINGTIGNVAKYNNEDVILGKSAAYLVFKSKESADYAYYQIQSICVKKQFEDGLTGTTIKNLGLNTIRNTLIPIPQIQEQQGIYSVLTDIDWLLRELDGVIAKKRAIKQGAMQELLTGKRRLEGFTGEWDEKKLGKVVDFQRGQVLTSAQYVTGNVPVVAGGKTFAGYHNKPNRKGKTICISASGAYAGFVSYYEIPIFASDCSTIGEGKNYDIRFVYYFLLAHQDDIYKMQTGGAQPHIHPKDVAPMDFHYPKDIEEQTAIANILSDMDEEIAALEAKRAKYEQVKQGMMQELLTGRVRF